MRHISSKLIVFTLFLTSSLLILTAFLSFSILKRESRAYTFQGQLLQAELISETLQSDLTRIDEITESLLALHPESHQITDELKAFFERSQKPMPTLRGVGILLNTAKDHWYEFPEKSISTQGLPNGELNATLLQKNTEDENHFVAFIPAKNATLAVRLDLSKALQNCSHLNITLYNNHNEPIHYCNPESKNLFQKSTEVLAEINRIQLKSGTLERNIDSESYLWAYSHFSTLGKIITLTTQKAAYAPAYALAIRVITLIIMAIGLAIVASILISKRITNPIEEVTRATEKIAGGDFDAKILIETKDETRVLANSVESMASKIKILLESEVEKAKLDAQLEVAGAVQRTLIPKSEVELKNTKIYSYYRPADQCGGDWWGYVQNQNILALMIGDVSGHGYASALLVATTRGFLSMLQNQIESSDPKTICPEPILRSLNGVVFDATRAELNMTSMCVVMNLDTGEYQVSSAGHNAAYHFTEFKEVHSVHAMGPRLGEGPLVQEPIETVTGQLKVGEKLVLYTDGIQDLGPESNPLGRKGFKKFLTQQINSSAQGIVQSVESELYPLNEGRPLQDDLTFIAIERNA